MNEVSQYDTVISKLDDTYSNGRANGNLLFFGSSVMIHSDGGIDASLISALPACYPLSYYN